MSSDRRRWERERASRRGTPQEIRARTARGADLVRRALAGEAVPDDTAVAASARPQSPPPARFELVSCSACYAPHEGLPNTLCTRCEARP